MCGHEQPAQNRDGGLAIAVSVVQFLFAFAFIVLMAIKTKQPVCGPPTRDRIAPGPSRIQLMATCQRVGHTSVIMPPQNVGGRNRGLQQRLLANCLGKKD